MSETYDPETAAQPLPKASEHREVWPAVVARLEAGPYARAFSPELVAAMREDMLARHRHGIRKYGHPLRAHNGRDALRDLYDEQLDALAYSGQALDEVPACETFPSDPEWSCSSLQTAACPACQRRNLLADLHRQLMAQAATVRSLLPPVLP